MMRNLAILLALTLSGCTSLDKAGMMEVHVTPHEVAGQVTHGIEFYSGRGMQEVDVELEREAGGKFKARYHAKGVDAASSQQVVGAVAGQAIDAVQGVGGIGQR